MILEVIALRCVLWTTIGFIFLTVLQYAYMAFDFGGIHADFD